MTTRALLLGLLAYAPLLWLGAAHAEAGRCHLPVAQ